MSTPLQRLSTTISPLSNWVLGVSFAYIPRAFLLSGLHTHIHTACAQLIYLPGFLIQLSVPYICGPESVVYNFSRATTLIPLDGSLPEYLINYSSRLPSRALDFGEVLTIGRAIVHLIRVEGPPAVTPRDT